MLYSGLPWVPRGRQEGETSEECAVSGEQAVSWEAELLGGRSPALHRRMAGRMQYHHHHLTQAPQPSHLTSLHPSSLPRATANSTFAKILSFLCPL